MTSPKIVPRFIVQLHSSEDTRFSLAATAKKIEIGQSTLTFLARQSKESVENCQRHFLRHYCENGDDPLFAELREYGKMLHPARPSTDEPLMMESENTPSIWAVVRRQLAWLSIPLMFALAAALALEIDCAVSKWWLRLLQDPDCSRCFRKSMTSVCEFFGLMENFGDGLGVAVVLIVIFVLDPARRWALPRLIGCAFGAGLAANGIKLLLVRTRPHCFGFAGDVWATFGAWLPGASAGSIGQSFPSGHTATAVGFAAALVWLYPRGRWLFPLFAFFVGCQRIQSGAHFPSDVLAGASLGSLVAIAFLKCGLLPGWMDRLESLMRSKPNARERVEQA